MADMNQQANEQRMARALKAIERLQSRLDAVEGAAREPIAIVGIGCRFPGGANSPDTFWQLLREGRDAVGPVPADRWSADALHSIDADAPGTVVTREGGFIDAPDQFDAAFFGIAPKEAQSLDPQQRLLLEVGWEAMEHAGVIASTLAGKAVGVFVGISSNDYSHMLLSRPAEDFDAYLATGNAHSVAAGRLSYTFGFSGPSMIVDTACSSSLVAVHLACQSLRAGECEMALAGGVNRILTADGSIAFSRAHMLAPDGRCKAFDASADGFSRAEGCGVIVLKRLSDARRDGDTVLALVRGSAVNQDGRSGGLTVPNGPAQQNVIRHALRNAGIEPAAVDYVEAHGTGTALGDPIEAGALGAVFAATRVQPLLVGSVKTNVGHLEAAAGICGLIKVALAMRNETLPAQLHFQNPSPHVDWAAQRLDVVASARPWQGGDARYAGVSSFGFSGTNAHIVLQAAASSDVVAAPALPKAGSDALLLAARDETALRELAIRYADFLPSTNSDWRTLCASARGTRSPFAQRLTLVASNSAEAVQQLRGFAAGQHSSVKTASVAAAPRIAFLFTGQGSQYVGMAHTLYAGEPQFRAVIDHCDQLLQAEEGWSLLSLLNDAQRMDQTRYAQPALFAIAHALSVLWQSRGVKPVAVLGHSIGEFAAAVAAGIIDVDTGLRLTAARGRLMQALPEGGAMASVLASAARLQHLLPADVAIAAFNAPDASVISGNAASITQLLPLLAGQGIEAKLLPVSHAFHSPLMQPMLAQFAAIASQQRYASSAMPFYSTVSGKRINAETLDADYWVRHIAAPVQFESALDALLAGGIDCCIELGPQAQLLALAKRWQHGDDVHWLPSLRRAHGDDIVMAESLAQLYLRGWRPLPSARASTIDLPTYPFQRQRFWFNTGTRVKTAHKHNDGHTLLGKRMALASGPVCYQAHVDAVQLDWPQQHTVFDTVVLPAAGFVEIGLAAAKLLKPAMPLQLARVDFHQALRLDTPRTLQTVLTTQHDGSRFEIFSRELNAEDDAPWTSHASGVLFDANAAAIAASDLAAARSVCHREISNTACYQRLAAQGVGYGAAFHALQQVWVDAGNQRVLSRLQLPQDVARDAAAYAVHPVLLDACLQSVAALFIDDGADKPTYLPAAIDALTSWQTPLPSQCWCDLGIKTGSDVLLADFTVYADDGSTLLQVSGLQLRPANVARVRQDTGNDWLYAVNWQPQPLPELQQLAAPQLPAPPVLAAQLQAVYATELAHADSQAYLQLLPRLEQLAAQYARRVLADLGFSSPVSDAALASVARDAGITENGFALWRRLNTLASSADLLDWTVLRDEHAALLMRYPQATAELSLLQRSVAAMADVLRGNRSAVEVLFPRGDASDLTKLYESSPGARLMNTLARAACEKLLQALSRPARVLEIGAGTGGTTAHLLPLLSGGEHRYDFTDISPTLLQTAQQRFGNETGMRFTRLDIEQPPAAQGFENAAADIVIAANVLHATADLRRTLQHAASLLAPGGALLLLEIVQPLGWLDLIFGLTDGWWKFTDRDVRADHPLLTSVQWQSLLQQCGFDAVAALGNAAGQLPQNVIVARRSAADISSPLIFADASEALPQAAMQSAMGCQLQPLPVSVDVAQRALQSVNADTVVYVAPVAKIADPALLQASISGLLYLVQALAAMQSSRATPTLVVVTRGACSAVDDATDPAQAALWGMARVVALEHPEWRCRRIDIDARADISSQLAQLHRELARSDNESSVAWSQHGRVVPRLERLAPMPQQPFELALAQHGSADDLLLRAMTRRVPQPHEVEIRVQAAGLNLIDVLDVLGVLPFERGWLGVECAGVVVAVGAAVRDLAVGDAVIALAPGSFRQFVTVDRNWVARRPSSLDAIAGATIPACFLTARHALAQVAQLQADERILIHAAASGTGLAAVKVAQQLGADVFATASTTKWDSLRAAGVRRIMNSRTLQFADQVQAAGGVDVVLNALSGEFIPASIQCLKPGGRFIEIGKRDVWSEQQVHALRPDVKYVCVDLMQLAHRDPAHIQALLQTLCAQFESAQLTALPSRAFTLARAADAFRLMQRGTHTGKLVLDFDIESAPIRNDATYLISGGLGGLGMATAQWLIEQGAQHLLLLGRSAPNAQTQSLLQAMRAQGVAIDVVQADIADATALQRIFENLRVGEHPLRGIFHAAGQLDDGVLQQLDWQRISSVLAPKVDGAWNLHTLSLDLPIEHFVLYSSAASLLGSPGQASHVAANSYLDALAHYRRGLGLPALSINWGPWSDIGSAADKSTHAQMHARGVGSIAPQQGMALFAQLMQRRQLAQAGVVPVRWADFARTGAIVDPFFSAFANQLQSTATQAAVIDTAAWARIATLPKKQRHASVVRLLQTEVAAVLGASARRPDAGTGFFDMGMDSLMAVELRNRLGRQTGITLASSSIFEYPTIDALARHLLEHLNTDEKHVAQTDAENSAAGVTPPAAPTATTTAAADSGFDAEIDAELAALDQLLRGT